MPEAININEIINDLIVKERRVAVEELRLHAVSIAKNLRRFQFPDGSAERKKAYGSKSRTDANLSGFCTAIEILCRSLPESERATYYAEKNRAVELACIQLPLPEVSRG